MLDERDLQSIANLMDEKIGVSESRMTASMDEKITASESRIMASMDGKINTATSQMIALMEAYFEPKFSLLADEMKLIQEKLVPAEAVTTIEDRVDVLEAVARRHSQDTEMLKKAQ